MLKDKVNIVTKNIPVKYIQTEQGEFKVNEVLEILEELKGTNRFGDMIVIYDNKLATWLEDMKVIMTTNGGAAYSYKNLESFEKELKEVLKK